MAKKNLVIDNPDLMSAWDWEKNNAEQIYPENYANGSRQKAWWICDKGHSYLSRIAHKNEGHMCPYCSGRKAISGETDLATLYPEIASQWDYEKNCPTRPDTVKPMCNDEVWWICQKGHHYPAKIVNRVLQGSGCPYCSNAKVLAGFNDLKTLFPELALEWDYKTNTIGPTEITLGSDKRVNWICKRGHSYSASPSSRKRGRGCPYCSNKRLLVGFNDLATVFPEISSEWDYQKNIGATPHDYVYGSGVSVHWKCKKGHEWKTPIINRTRDGNGCPICNKAKTVSFPEKALLFYVRKHYPNAISNFRSKLEKHSGHSKELPEYSIGTVEHIMPKTLSDKWKEYLAGKKDTQAYELFLNTIGNLTLTNYNSELSNSDFSTKKMEYAKSNYYFTQDLTTYTDWTSVQIQMRADQLSNLAISIWALPEKYNSSTPAMIVYNLDSDVGLFTRTKLDVVSIFDEEKRGLPWYMFSAEIAKKLHELDKDAFRQAISMDNIPGASRAFSNKPDDIPNAIKIDEDLYMGTKFSTAYCFKIAKILVENFGLISKTSFKDDVWFTIK